MLGVKKGGGISGFFCYNIRQLHGLATERSMTMGLYADAKSIAKRDPAAKRHLAGRPAVSRFPYLDLSSAGALVLSPSSLFYCPPDFPNRPFFHRHRNPPGRQNRPRACSSTTGMGVVIGETAEIGDILYASTRLSPSAAPARRKGKAASDTGQQCAGWGRGQDPRPFSCR